GLINRLRRFVRPDGAPLAHGFFAIGDAHTCTNPLYGRGSSLAVLQATLVADALAAHPNDRDAAARAYEQSSAARVEPWFHVSVMTDAAAQPSSPSAAPAPPPAAPAGGPVGPPPPRPGHPPPDRRLRRSRALRPGGQDHEPPHHAPGGVRGPRRPRAPRRGRRDRATPGPRQAPAHPADQ